MFGISIDFTSRLWYYNKAEVIIKYIVLIKLNSYNLNVVQKVIVHKTIKTSSL